MESSAGHRVGSERNDLKRPGTPGHLRSVQLPTLRHVHDLSQVMQKC